MYGPAGADHQTTTRATDAAGEGAGPGCGNGGTTPGCPANSADAGSGDAGAAVLSWLYLDRQGTVRATADSTGVTTSAAAYTDYGVLEPAAGTLYAGAGTEAAPGQEDRGTTPPLPVTTTVSPVGYTGEQLNPAAGLNHYHARDYQPATTRWLQPDPWAGNTTMPATLGKYTYVIGNPITLVDFLGEKPQYWRGHYIGDVPDNCSITAGFYTICTMPPAGTRNVPYPETSGGKCVLGKATHGWSACKIGTAPGGPPPAPPKVTTRPPQKPPAQEAPASNNENYDAAPCARDIFEGAGCTDEYLDKFGKQVSDAGRALGAPGSSPEKRSAAAKVLNELRHSSNTRQASQFARVLLDLPVVGPLLSTGSDRTGRRVRPGHFRSDQPGSIHRARNRSRSRHLPGSCGWCRCRRGGTERAPGPGIIPGSRRRRMGG